MVVAGTERVPISPLAGELVFDQQLAQRRRIGTLRLPAALFVDDHPGLVHRALDPNHATGEIDVFPGQPTKLTQAETGVKRRSPKRPVRCREDAEKPGGLLRRSYAVACTPYGGQPQPPTQPPRAKQFRPPPSARR